MRKKSILIIILLLMLTGCDVEYNLEFKNTTLYETTNFYMYDSNNIEKELRDIVNYDQYVMYNDINKVYQSELIPNNKGYVLQYKADYLYLQLKDTQIARNCYSLVDAYESDNKYYFITNKQFNCNVYQYIYVDKVTITFKTNHKVLEHNADKIIDNTYYWYISPNENNEKDIKMVVDKETTGNKKNFLNLNILFTLSITIGIILIVSIIMVIYIYRKNIKNNKI